MCDLNLNYHPPLWWFPQTLLTIAENLLREPESPKFKQFKPTNTVIQRELMNPKGTIEYAIQVCSGWRLCRNGLILSTGTRSATKMGFRPEVCILCYSETLIQRLDVLIMRAQVKDFQPYYVFHPRHMEDLRIGAAILREHINLETEKAERAARAKANEKANAAAAAERVCDIAFFLNEVLTCVS